MCGIVGYVGKKQVVPLIIDGLRKLEYRGYDSAGIAVVDKNHNLKIQRAEAQKGDMRDTYADTTLAKKDLGFSPKVTLEEGIQAEYRWLASSPALV